MKRNPLIPFALIAALGIIVMFVFSFQGLNKSKELADAKNGGKPAQTASKPEDIVKQSCTSCHGDQLQGAVGPNLQKNWWKAFERRDSRSYFERKRKHATKFSSS